MTREVWAAAYRGRCAALAAELREQAHSLPLPDQEQARRAAAWKDGLRLLLRQERLAAGEIEPRRGERVLRPDELAELRAAHEAETEALAALPALLDDAERDALLQRAAHVDRRGALLPLCGRSVQVRACGGCAEPRPGSALLAPAGGSQWCHARACEVCGHYESLQRAARLEGALQEVELQPGHSLYLLTFTARQVGKGARTWQEMRAFAECMLDAIRGAWDPLRVFGLRRFRGGLKVRACGKTVSGLFSKLEISDSGTIHAHALYLGPYVVAEALAELMRRRFADAGFIDARRVATPEDLAAWRAALLLSPAEQLAPAPAEVLARVGGAVREVSKYLTKAPGPRDEGYIRGARRERLDPELAARWECALYRMRTAAAYGVFRGLADPSGEEVLATAALAVAEGFETGRQAQERDGATVCACCGSVGGWHWRPMAAGAYLVRVTLLDPGGGRPQIGGPRDRC